jgi:hypothetical protein
MTTSAPSATIGSYLTFFLKLWNMIGKFVSKVPQSEGFYSRAIIAIAGENNRDDEDDALLNKIFLERREGGGPRK